jgi:hypothetical protein
MDNTIARLEQSMASYVKDINSLKKSHASWTLGDARIRALMKCFQVLNSTWLGYLLLRNSRRDSTWSTFIQLDDIPSKDQRQKEIKGYMKDFETFLMVGCVQFLFSSMESSFRIYVRAIDPIACNNGKSSFASISD